MFVMVLATVLAWCGASSVRAETLTPVDGTFALTPSPSVLMQGAVPGAPLPFALDRPLVLPLPPLVVPGHEPLRA